MKNELLLDCVLRNKFSESRELLESGADSNFISKRSHNKTSFLQIATRECSVEMVTLLLRYNADANYQDKNGHTPLHLAAELDCGEVVNVLLNHNANANAVDKYGRYPHQLTHGQLRVKLFARWAKAQYDDLLKLGTVRPDQVKVCFIGSPKAGKTTLACVLSGKFTLPGEDDRTAGIDVIVVDIPDAGGRLAFYDTAGHAIFHNAHSLFFRGACIIFAYVVDTSLRKQEILQDAIYFFALVKSTRLTDDPSPHVIFFGSRGEKGKMSKTAMCYHVIDVLKEKFGDAFEIYKDPIILDCRNRLAEEIQMSKAVLAEIKKKCIERASEVPLVCQKMRCDVLPVLRRERLIVQEGPFMAKADFEKVTQREVSEAFVGELFERLLSYLQESGEVVDLSDEVIFEVSWLLNVLTPAMSNRYFFIHAIDNSRGIVTIEDLAIALQTLSKVHGIPPVGKDAAIKILRLLHLCFPLRGQPNSFLFPTLIEEDQREEEWKKEADKPVYVGRRVQCESEIEIIAPAVFFVIQSMLAAREDVITVFWKGGLKLFKVTEATEADMQIPIEALIEIADEKRAITAIDVIARGPPYSEGECKKFVDELVFKVMQAKDERSPGTSVVLRYLSYTQISKHQRNPVSYLQEEVEEVQAKGGILKPKNANSPIFDYLVTLVAVEDAHVILIPAKLYTDICDWLESSRHWRLLGALLGVDEAKLQKSGSARMMMDEWRQHLDATTPRLVAALKEINR